MIKEVKILERKSIFIFFKNHPHRLTLNLTSTLVLTLNFKKILPLDKRCSNQPKYCQTQSPIDT